jgi:hypothetical protein
MQFVLKQDPKVIEAHERADQIRDFLKKEAEASPCKWATLILWSPKKKEMFAIPSWIEAVNLHIFDAIVGHELVNINEGNVTTCRTQDCAPQVPIAVVSIMDEMHTKCQWFLNTGFVPEQIEDEITACMDRLRAEVQGMNQRSERMKKRREESLSPLQAGDVLQSLQKGRATVVRASGEWATVAVGKAKPVRRKVHIDDYWGPYVCIANSFDRFHRFPSGV